jgi:hypothetical protein
MHPGSPRLQDPSLVRIHNLQIIEEAVHFFKNPKDGKQSSSQQTGYLTTGLKAQYKVP